jgi:hypothetical protein
MRVIIDDVAYVPDVVLPDDADVYDLALNAPMKYSNDFDDLKVVDWLYKLLQTLWDEEECFSGRRPFGSNGWSLDLIYSLVDCGYIPGTIDRDEDGDLYDCTYDPHDADRLISDLIKYAFYRKVES